VRGAGTPAGRAGTTHDDLSVPMLLGDLDDLLAVAADLLEDEPRGTMETARCARPSPAG
jgi:hypothetical protein